MMKLRHLEKNSIKEMLIHQSISLRLSDKPRSILHFPACQLDVNPITGVKLPGTVGLAVETLDHCGILGLLTSMVSADQWLTLALLFPSKVTWMQRFL